ncbi:MAG: hypothetical protein ACXVCP_08395 [Bdellovibrio sp.]
MKNKNNLVIGAIFSIIAGGLAGCSSRNVKEEFQRKIVLDNALSGEKLPQWTRDGKVSWEDGKEHFIRAQYTIRGDQRVNACYDLAKMELKENLITEISSEIKGEINAATEGVAESADPGFNKSFRQSMDATIRGLRIKEQLFERYVINDTERVDCFVLAMIPHGEYQNLKNNILTKMASTSPEIAEALKKRQVKFFASENE